MITAQVEVEEKSLLTIEETLYELAPHNWVLNHCLLTEKSTLQGFFENITFAERSLAELLAKSGISIHQNLLCKTIKDTDWKNSYKKHFHPWKFNRFHWVPIWDKDSYAIPKGDYKLYLDPNMAFGTGNHETTKLCLETTVTIAKSIAENQKISFLDVGCGSGILALTASKLGYSIVHGIDIDESAIKVSIENSRLNTIPNILFERKSIQDFRSKIYYDIVIANIQADVLKKCAVALTKLLKKKSHLILSGILKTEKEDVQNHFQKLFYKKKKVSISSKNMNEWNLIVIEIN